MSGDAEFPLGAKCGVSLEECLRDLPGRRHVWRASLLGHNRDVLVKIYRKHAKQQRDVSLELGNAKELTSAGLPVPRLLFKAGCGEDVAVVYEFIPNGRTLDEFDFIGEDGTRDEILRQLIEVHVAAHAGGGCQSDNHLGNYLWADGRLWMLDAGSFLFQDGALSSGKVTENLAMLEASFAVADAAYLRAAIEQNYPTALDGLEVAVKRCLRLRRDAYFKKTQRSCTEFEHLREGSNDWRACRNMDQDLKRELLRDPDQFFEDAEWLKKGNTSSVVVLQYGGKEYILKRYNRKSLLYRWQHMMSKPRALASWSNGHVLRLFGVATPRPIACLLVKTGPLLGKAYLLMERVSGVSLGWLLYYGKTEKIPRAGEKVCDLLKALDTLLITHGDMKASNFILDEDGELHMIDLDGTELHSDWSSFDKKMRKDMTRFIRNWEKYPEVERLVREVLEESRAKQYTCP